MTFLCQIERKMGKIAGGKKKQGKVIEKRKVFRDNGGKRLGQRTLERGRGMNLLRTKPIFKQMIWGGSRMADQFGYELPGDHTGEAWAVSAHPSGDCVVEYEGCDWRLSDLWREHRELFGGMEREEFPLLTKIIDAAADLSIQVHPDDTYAQVQENGALGKTECWYILDAEPGATIIIGHHARTKEELRQMVAEKRFGELIREVPVKAGDFFQIEPGCVHAIKGGTLLLETQQSSDITYRLYDYDRLQDGKPRELHLEKSMDVITCPMKEAVTETVCRYQGENGSLVEQLVRCDHYTVARGKVEGQLTLADIRGKEPAPYFDIFSVIAGEGNLDGVDLKKGDHFLLPYGYEEEKQGLFQGNLEFIHAIP